jgi:3-deoxy-D-manno-octulosonic-acid transferase
MCNAQYPSKSLARDNGGARADLMKGFAGALVKSNLQRDRFANVGVPNIVVTGELRFDQTISPAQIALSTSLRQRIAPGRPVITFASVVAGEDAIYLDAIRKLRAAGNNPLVVYVPRAPERFDATAQLLADAAFTVTRRSAISDTDTAHIDTDALLGDSMGEMYLYLALCDRAVVGGGFTPHGAHNIIEALALRKPVIVGPEIHTIEYPATEAIAVGVCTRVETPEALLAALTAPLRTDGIDAFFQAHAGAVARTLDAIDRLTSR